MNTRVRSACALVLFAVTLAPVASAQADVEYKTGAVLFVQKAAEYRALCLQAFNAAKRLVDDDRRNLRTLPRKERRRPAAIVVDIDETLLDNSPLEVENIRLKRGFNLAAFNEWNELRIAKAVPGALEFAKYAERRGVKVIYISNRAESVKKATIDNLSAVGFPNVSEETVLLSPTGSGTKEPRRQVVAAKYRIIGLIGDNLGDMTEEFDRGTPAERAAAVDKHFKDWGSRFIVLPNPMYGTWENAVYEYKRLSDPEKSKARDAALEGIRR
jgi:5'-nucleotidase (lipoprotein e(P4) family)